MKLFVITVAYAPAALVARSLILYRKYRYLRPYRHIVVQGHYPINEKKNTNDIKLLVNCFEDIELLDPGKNLGSAQSQNWALQHLDIGPDDFFINLDPDSACCQHDWDNVLLQAMKNPECILASCNAPMIQRYRQSAPFTNTFKDGRLTFGVPEKPTPFNLSLWRYSFIKQIGGIPQGGLWWGEVEGAMWGAMQRAGKFHCYSLDVMENEMGKQMSDATHFKYKDAHMRSSPENQFLGSYSEYLAWKHPHLLEIDTCIDLTDLNFR